MIRYGAAFILSFVFALYWTPLMRRAALQLGIIDTPDGKLKKQNSAVPYFGGVAVFLGFLLTVGVLTDFDKDTLGLLLSGSIALMVGLTRLIWSRCAAMTSRADAFFVRISVARSRALIKQRSSPRVIVGDVADWDAASAAPRLAAAAIAVLAPAAFRKARRLCLLAMKMRVYLARLIWTVGV